MNLEQARFNMIEQQIRTWEVLDQKVLDLLYVVKREDFVPYAYRQLAFADTQIPLGHGSAMLPPKLEAHALQALKVRKSDRVLEIGSGSGYMAALLAAHAAQVWTVEIEPEIAAMATENLKRNGIDNATVVCGDGVCGWPSQAPFDIIMVSGSLPAVPQALLDQLRVGGRLLAFVGEDPLMQAQLITRRDERNFDTVWLLDTQVPALKNTLQARPFSL
jgi:protein-L-isoaspartate(D-aspartate) O-methyltransferase